MEHALIELLSVADKQYWIQNGAELEQVLAKALRRNYLTKAIVSAFLVLVGTVRLPATTGEFSAQKNFVVNVSDNAEVKIYQLSTKFKELFLDDVVGAETQQIKRKLHCNEFTKNLSDESIIAQLGGDKKAETFLLDVFACMKMQGKGEQGILLTNGLPNIFYVRDTDGVLHSVRLFWNTYGWFLSAGKLGHPGGWDRGCRVLSFN